MPGRQFRIVGTDRELIEIEFGSLLYREELELRDEVLRKPIGLKYSEADLEKEPGYRHFGLLSDGQLAACLMVVPHPENVAQIRQMAVREDLQGQGWGRHLMRSVEELLTREGRVRSFFLNARHTAIGFYTGLGYVITGDPFTEVGIPHRRMEKQIRG